MLFFLLILAPKEAPTEVHVNVVDHNTIKVDWRGVSTDQSEEPLQGYKVSLSFQEMKTTCCMIKIMLIIINYLIQSGVII